MAKLSTPRKIILERTQIEPRLAQVEHFLRILLEDRFGRYAYVQGIPEPYPDDWEIAEELSRVRVCFDLHRPSVLRFDHVVSGSRQIERINAVQVVGTGSAATGALVSRVRTTCVQVRTTCDSGWLKMRIVDDLFQISNFRSRIRGPSRPFGPLRRREFVISLGSRVKRLDLASSTTRYRRWF